VLHGPSSPPRARRRAFAGLLLLAIAASPALAQIPLELLSISPGRGRANLTPVLAPQITVRGLPSNVENSLITVTLTGRVETYAKTGTVIGRSDLTTRIRFPLDGPMEPGQYAVSVQALIGGQQYSSPAKLPFRILGEPSIVVEPAVLLTNTTATVVVRGTETTFTEGVTTLEAGPGVTVNRFRVDSETQMTVQIATGKTAGQKTMTARTEAETASTHFEVQNPQPVAMRLRRPGSW
jgi:hypothetical protein